MSSIHPRSASPDVAQVYASWRATKARYDQSKSRRVAVITGLSAGLSAGCLATGWILLQAI